MNCDCYLSFYGYLNFKRVIAAPKPTLPVFKTVSGSGLRGKEFIELPNDHRFELMSQRYYCLAMGIAWLARLVDDCKTPKEFCALIKSIYKAQQGEENKADSEQAFPKVYKSLTGRVVNFKESFHTDLSGIYDFLRKNKSGVFIFYWYFEDATKNCAHAITCKYDPPTRKYTVLNPSTNYAVLSVLDSIDDLTVYISAFINKEEESAPDLKFFNITTMTVKRQKLKGLEVPEEKKTTKRQKVKPLRS